MSAPRLEPSRAAGRYMAFRLADETYGVQILKVRELVGLLDITRVPNAPPALRGVVNLRGKVIPVVDLRTKFGMGATLPGPQSVIMVLEHARPEPGQPLAVLGALVDEVVEVLAFGATDIEPPPAFGGTTLPPEYFLGVGKAGNRLVMLLDMDRVLSASEAAFVDAAMAAP